MKKLSKVATGVAAVAGIVSLSNSVLANADTTSAPKVPVVTITKNATTNTTDKQAAVTTAKKDVATAQAQVKTATEKQTTAKQDLESANKNAADLQKKNADKIIQDKKAVSDKNADLSKAQDNEKKANKTLTDSKNALATAQKNQELANQEKKDGKVAEALDTANKKTKQLQAAVTKDNGDFTLAQDKYNKLNKKYEDSHKNLNDESEALDKQKEDYAKLYNESLSDLKTAQALSKSLENQINPAPTTPASTTPAPTTPAPTTPAPTTPASTTPAPTTPTPRSLAEPFVDTLPEEKSDSLENKQLIAKKEAVDAYIKAIQQLTKDKGLDDTLKQERAQAALNIQTAQAAVNNAEKDKTENDKVIEDLNQKLTLFKNADDAVKLAESAHDQAQTDYETAKEVLNQAQSELATAQDTLAQDTGEKEVAAKTAALADANQAVTAATIALAEKQGVLINAQAALTETANNVASSVNAGASSQSANDGSTTDKSAGNTTQPTTDHKGATPSLTSHHSVGDGNVLVGSGAQTSSETSKPSTTDNKKDLDFNTTGIHTAGSDGQNVTADENGHCLTFETANGDHYVAKHLANNEAETKPAAHITGAKPATKIAAASAKALPQTDETNPTKAGVLGVVLLGLVSAFKLVGLKRKAL